MATASEYLLGRGIYTPQEAAFYARVETRLLNRWLFGNKQGKSTIIRELEDMEGKIITFNDFIQALAIREIRKNYQVPLQRIRDAVHDAKERFGIDYPFARKHTTYLFRGHLYIRRFKEEESEEEIYEQISGKSKGQTAITKVIELYKRDLHYSSEGLAEFYRAYHHVYNDAPKYVVMHPKRRFGEPMVDACSISAIELYEASIAEGGMEKAAYLYEVELDDVDLACRYIDYLSPIPPENITV